MINNKIAYLLGCIDPFIDETEMTEEDIKYYSNFEVQNIINKMKILCFKYVVESIDKKTFDEEYNEMIFKSNLGDIERNYINKRRINLLDMMLNQPKEEEKINDGKFHLGDEIPHKKLIKKEGDIYE